MNRPGLVAGGIVLAVLLISAFSAFFTVDQTQLALVLQFGEPRQVISEPGLKVKVPFVQNVLFFDKRLLNVDPPEQEVIMADQKRIDADAYARFRIVDPLAFYQAVVNEDGARSQLGAVINSSMRRVLGSVPLAAILSPERDRIMASIQQEVTDAAKRFGVQVIDVRLRRADLPEQTSQAIYQRMISERQREAKQYRAEGAQQGLEIRAKADRDKVVLLAEAANKAQGTRGEGDATSIKIYADAFGKDPQFFAFYRSMEAYREALGNSDTTMILSPDSEFFRFFGSDKGANPPAAGAAK
jgi:modulator of FtsH protease HflC